MTIREVAKRTGVSSATLRMWESRYGFPRPERLESGHRRYSEDECERIAQVVRDRDGGLSLPAAIAKSSTEPSRPDPSVFAGLRRRRPDLLPYLLPKSTLIGLSHAIEDECAARAERPLLVGTFQRERYYRDAEPRWRDLSETADLAVAMADFDERRDPPGAPIELPVDRSEGLGREWTLLCEAANYSACLSAWERPGQDHVDDMDRSFETIWTIEPEAVREGVHIVADLVAERAPDVFDYLSERARRPPPPNADQMKLVSALSSRMVAYVGSSDPMRGFTPHRS